MIFFMKYERFLTLHRQKGNYTTIKAQKLFVHKENKNNFIDNYFFSSGSVRRHSREYHDVFHESIYV